MTADPDGQEFFMISSYLTTTSCVRERLLITLVLISVVMAALLPTQAATQQATEAEVIAVEDRTATTGCEVTSETHSDADHTQLIKRITAPCPPGSVLHSVPMSLREANAKGLQYITVTGNPVADNVALVELRWDILANLGFATLITMNSAMNRDAISFLASCPGYFYSKSLSYVPGAVGGRVRVTVGYRTNTFDCDGSIEIHDAVIRFEQAPNPGEDLYWDQAYYSDGINAWNWDMGCKQIGYSNTYNYMYGWYGYPGYTYTDETINETTAGCEWYGEEYTGSVVLSI